MNEQLKGTKKRGWSSGCIVKTNTVPSLCWANIPGEGSYLVPSVCQIKPVSLK